MTAVSDPRLLALSREASDRDASRVQELWSRAPIGFAATAVNSLILAGILHEHVPPGPLWGWLAVLALVTAIRTLQWQRYKQAVAAGRLDARRWQLYFTLGIGVAGVVWGSSALFLFAGSIPHQTFLAFVLGGMVAGASATFSAEMSAFLAFTVPALVPLSLRFFLEGDNLHVAMGAMTLLFGVLLSATAYRIHTVTAKWHDTREQLGHAHSHLSSKAERTEKLSKELSDARAALSTQDQDLGERVVKYMVEVTDILTTLEDTVSEPLEIQQRVALHRQKIASLTTFARGLVQHAGRPAEEIEALLAKVWKNPERYPSLESLTRTLVSIENANDDLSALLHGLRHYAETSGSTFETLDLNELAKTVTNHWMNASRFEGQLWTAYSDAPSIDADRSQVSSALESLLANASEAVEPRNGWIEVTTKLVETRDVDLSHAFLHEPSLPDRYVVLSVTDNGVGISAETLERVIDPFFSSKVAERGFRRGMGLAGAAGTMRRHRGELTIESRPLEGTSVSLFFPLREAARSRE